MAIGRDRSDIRKFVQNVYDMLKEGLPEIGIYLNDTMIWGYAKRIVADTIPGPEDLDRLLNMEMGVEEIEDGLLKSIVRDLKIRYIGPDQFVLFAKDEGRKPKKMQITWSSIPGPVADIFDEKDMGNELKALLLAELRKEIDLLSEDQKPIMISRGYGKNKSAILVA